jgi:hypothetical protein
MHVYGVVPVPLPNLTPKSVLEHGLIAAIAGANQVNASLTADDCAYFRTEMTALLPWLWDEIAGPVLTAAGITDAPADERWRRIWWAPDSTFALLPIHAAGYHDQRHRQRPDTVLDRSARPTFPRWARFFEPVATLAPIGGLTGHSS